VALRRGQNAYICYQKVVLHVKNENKNQSCYFSTKKQFCKLPPFLSRGEEFNSEYNPEWNSRKCDTLSAQERARRGKTLWLWLAAASCVATGKLFEARARWLVLCCFAKWILISAMTLGRIAFTKFSAPSTLFSDAHFLVQPKSRPHYSNS
jgi:hypothetical protein